MQVTWAKGSCRFRFDVRNRHRATVFARYANGRRPEIQVAHSDDGFGARTRPELCKNRADVDLDRTFGKIKLTANEFVRVAAYKKAQHIELSRAELQGFDRFGSERQQR